MASPGSEEDRAPLATLGKAVQVHFNIADLLFKNNPYWDQHVPDEAFGDEFKNH